MHATRTQQRRRRPAANTTRCTAPYVFHRRKTTQLRPFPTRDSRGHRCARSTAAYLNVFFSTFARCVLCARRTLTCRQTSGRAHEHARTGSCLDDIVTSRRKKSDDRRFHVNVGNEVVRAPLDRLPVRLRSDAIVTPMSRTGTSTRDRGRFDLHFAA